jgi:hypothetical protein
MGCRALTVISEHVAICFSKLQTNIDANGHVLCGKSPPKGIGFRV